MIRLLKILALLALVWTGYWFAAGWGLRQGLAEWFATQAARGWQADYADIQAGGYPLRHRHRLNAPALADPGTGTAWRAAWLELDSPAIWPGRMTLRLPDSPQRLSHLDRSATLTAQAMEAALDLHPGPALELRRMALQSGPWALAEAGAPLARADSLTLAMTQAPETPESYDLRAEATGFAPGQALRRLAAHDAGLPERFQALRLDLGLRFDRPWDRRALEERRPQPRAIALRLAELHWGPMRFRASGTLSVDATGLPSGEVTLRAENWRDMLAIAEQSGALPAGAADVAADALEMMARGQGDPTRIDATLSLRGGRIWLGLFPLAPAPRLILR